MSKLIIIIGNAKGIMLQKLHNQQLKQDLFHGHLNDYRLIDAGNVSNEADVKTDELYAIDTVTGNDEAGESYLYSSFLEHTEDLALLSELFEYQPRLVEMYFGEAGNGGDSGTWFTDYVDIPIVTPDDKVEEVAINAAKAYANENNIAYVFLGVYNITTD